MGTLITIALAIAAYLIGRHWAKKQAAAAREQFYANARMPLCAMSENPFDRDAVRFRAEQMRLELERCGNKHHTPVFEYVYGAPIGGDLNLSEDFTKWRMDAQKLFVEECNIFVREKYRKSHPAATKAFADTESEYLEFDEA